MAAHSQTDSFAEQLDGRLIRPDDSGYDDARKVWNGMIDRRPAAIAQCATVDDVVRAVKFAQEQRLPVSVRGGGHSVAGSAVCDGALMVDVSPMGEIWIDEKGRTAVAQGGAKLGDLDRETQAHGLATTAGVEPATGVAGLTLGGGMGFLGRALGLTIDTLIGAEVVLADGRVVRASADEHPDLFWAIRGGGGNFAQPVTGESAEVAALASAARDAAAVVDAFTGRLAEAIRPPRQLTCRTMR